MGWHKSEELQRKMIRCFSGFEIISILTSEYVDADNFILTVSNVYSNKYLSNLLNYAQKLEKTLLQLS